MIAAMLGRWGRPTLDASVRFAAIAAAAGVGALTAVSPVLAVVTMAGLGALWLVSYGTAMIRVFHLGLVAILIGYAFLGRGMAYVGVSPIFVGEMVLALAGIAILVSVPTARWHPVHLVIGLFVAWGLYRTVPYIGRHGIDAFRDGVSYGYAVFAIAVSLTVWRHHMEGILRTYRRWIPLFVFWVPIAAIVSFTLSGVLPRVPGSDVPILVFKGGDTGVHLGAVGAFVLLGLGASTRTTVSDGIVWAGWLVAIGISAAVNRGGAVAASMMAAAILFGRGSIRWGSLVLVGLFLVAVVGLVDPQVDVGLARRISLDQLVANVLSIVGGRSDPLLEGTKEWRLTWWTEIIRYTIGGEYMWTGKGFGINLADADGFQVLADGSLRAPHNGHLELLARGGVPALALWVMVQLAFGLTMIRAAIRARSVGATAWVAVTGWIVVYWLAMLVNASFDVYLQGPMGGIWYWSVIGLGIAVAGIIDEMVARTPKGQMPAAVGSEGSVP